MPTLDEITGGYPPLPDSLPPPTHDEWKFETWRNRRCPHDHEVCFGVSPLYGTCVGENFGCLTPDELRVEAAKHTDTCACWKHSVLREYRRRLTRRST